MKKLIAYFSATGTTARLAKTLAQAADADLLEIKPKTPYTADDLDWTNKKSRSSVEMNNKASRPEIIEKPENIDEYDTIFIGFPIWWYIAPTIVNTFLESYDFSGKTVVLFATSGGSDMGRTLDFLKASCGKSVKWVSGRVWNANADKSELSAWIAEILK